MTWFIALLFGFVQGLTEFLPVSSSGHLALISMLTLENSDIFFTVLLHAATFISVCAAFRGDVSELLRAALTFVPDRVKRRPVTQWQRLLELMAVSLFPLAFAVPFRSRIEALFESPAAIGLALIATALLVLLSDRFGKGRKTLRDIKFRDALIIGLVQAAAIIPGLSRSGATLAAALFCGLDRDTAVKYSFILSLPTVLAAAALESAEAFAAGISPARLGPYALGFAAAAVTGYASIGLVRVLTGKGRLKYFSIYTAALGTGLLLSRLF